MGFDGSGDGNGFTILRSASSSIIIEPYRKPLMTLTTDSHADLKLPAGVRLRPLAMNRDPRGVFTEVFRAEWDTGIRPVQWNVVESRRNVLRGVHVHIRHADYLVLLRGSAWIGLRDLRTDSRTEGLATKVAMSGAEMQSIMIPPGVAHGFYFLEDSVHLYSVSSYWSIDDELGCDWADPALKIPWEISAPELSERDASASPLSELVRELEPWQPIGPSTRSAGPS